ncbi:MFS transporter [Glutamicibacter mishrai]|uniref:MFS transporter n=1 Tax=Glutamicibacter mishrai TaxID=1775880 RepID=UPI0020CF657F|nr:MFS transporter [Glutamicibacter mishrai]UTT39884.1 MFS transporter [Glutamicibacter mishrai]
MNIQSARSTANRKFWLYWGSYGASTFGTAISSVAFPIIAIQVLGTNEFETGLLAACSYVAWLIIGLPAGSIVQRLPLREAQVWMDLVRGAAVASIPLTWIFDALSFLQLVVVALIISFADVVYFVASATFIPHVVPGDQLQSRNSLMSGTHAVSQLGGPSIGGILIQVLGPVVTVLVNSVTYFISALLLRRLPSVTPNQDKKKLDVFTEIREGLRFTISDPLMRATLWNATIINFVGGMQLALFAIYLVRVQNVPAALLGFLLAFEGIGSLLGAGVSTWLVKAAGSARACIYASALLSVGGIIIPLGDGIFALIYFAVGSCLFAIGTVITSTTTRTYRQLSTPENLLSRVMATVRFISWGAVPIGSITAGLLGSQFGPRTALYAAAALGTLSLFVLLLSPVLKLRNFPDSQPNVSDLSSKHGKAEEN